MTPYFARYETRAEKAPAGLLPHMAEALGVSVDALLGIRQPTKFKTPDSRLTRRLQQIEKLDPQEKRQVMTLLDAFIERAQLKRQSA